MLFKEEDQIRDVFRPISDNQAFNPPNSTIDATLLFALFRVASCSFLSEATFWFVENQPS